MSQPIGPLMMSLRGKALQPSEIDFIKHPAVGGCVLFARNYSDRKQLQLLVSRLKRLRPELLLAVDHEGGAVQRLHGDGFTSLPAAATLGDHYNRDAEAATKQAYRLGRAAGRELRDAGFDTGFSPVLDLSNPHSMVLRGRTLHERPEAVVALAQALCSGLRDGGVWPVGKHFPGHGSVVGDTHSDVVSCPLDWASLKARDLRPFAELIAQGALDGVMSAHVVYEKIDPQVPATLSARFLQTVLRERLGFTGVVFSDDLSMGGLAGHDRVASKALAAGCDMALVCHNRRLLEASLNELGSAQLERYSRRLGERLNQLKAPAQPAPQAG